jgi:hypothetical protein
MALLDFEKYTASAMDRIVAQFKIDTDPIYSPRFRKGIKWFGYSLIPAILSFATVIIMFLIFFRIYGSLGFEKTVITLLVLTLFALNSQSK